MKIPAGWHAPTHALWEKGQADATFQSLINTINALAQQQKRSAPLFDQLSYYFFVTGRFSNALQMLEESNRLAPGKLETLRHLSVISKRLGKNAKSVAWAQKALAIAPDDFVSLDTLASGLYRLKRFDEAKRAGTRALVLKDQLAVRSAPRQPRWKLAAARPTAGQHRIAQRLNVMAFSLWGAQPRYLRGATGIESEQFLIAIGIDHSHLATAFEGNEDIQSIRAKVCTARNGRVIVIDTRRLVLCQGSEINARSDRARRLAAA